jgi:hypothetical protein
LVQRHIDHGKAPDEARAWVLGPDARNSDLVIRTRDRADVVVTGDAAQAVVSS